MENIITREMYKKVKKMDREQMDIFLNNLVDIKLRNRAQAYLDTINKSLGDSIKDILKNDFEFTQEDLNRFETIFNGGDDADNENQD